MGTSKEQMLIEANRRGLLTGERKAAFDEAVRRGLITLPEQDPNVPTLAADAAIGESPDISGDESSVVNDLKRGAGLGVRTLLETPGLTVAGLADMLAAVSNLGISGASKFKHLQGGDPIDFRFPTNHAQTIEEGFDRMGFPQPASEAEEIAQGAGRAVVSAGFGPASGGALRSSASPVSRGVGEVLQEAPVIQAASAAGSGAAGTKAQQEEAGPITQFMAELGGGMIAPISVAAGRTTMAATRTGLGVKDTFTQKGQRKIAGNILDDAVSNERRAGQNIDAAADNKTFGGLANKTTGEATKDLGLLSLERAVRSVETQGKFGQKLSQANARRQKILDVLGGDDVEVARQARDTSTGAQRDAALGSAKTGIPSQALHGRIDRILASPKGTRRVVREALNVVKRDVDRIVDADGTVDAARLYEIRKDINNAMQGKSERSDFRLAKSQLKEVKGIIDNEIERVAPGFKKYLEDYARLSRDIDQREIIQNIQQRATVANPDPSTGRDILSQAKFRRMVANERNAGNLTREQLDVLDAIATDLDSGSAINSATVRPPGSDTAKNLTVAHVIGRALGGHTDNAAINTLARPVKWVTSFSEDQVQALLIDAMLDPQLARQLLAEARPGEINRVSRSLRQLAGASLLSTELASQTQTQPREQTD